MEKGPSQFDLDDIGGKYEEDSLHCTGTGKERRTQVGVVRAMERVWKDIWLT